MFTLMRGAEAAIIEMMALMRANDTAGGCQLAGRSAARSS